MFQRGMQKPSHPEDEYFTREDAEKKRSLALQAKRATDQAERERLKALHFMHCPKCGFDMHEVHLRGLSVDVCFACGGVFLDKDEIEVIAAPRQKGAMAAILNWFKPEVETPVGK